VLFIQASIYLFARQQEIKSLIAASQPDGNLTEIKLSGVPKPVSKTSQQIDQRTTAVARKKSTHSTSRPKGRGLDIRPSSIEAFMVNSESMVKTGEAKTTLPVLIFEIQAGSGLNANEEFIKLYNPNNQAVDLAGWSLKRKSQSGKEYNLVSTSKFEGKIPPVGYFIIAHKDYSGLADLKYSNNSNPLSYSGDTVLLINSAGEIADTVNYLKLERGGIWQRPP